MKILNFGSLNLDKVYSVDHFIRPGETMSSEGMETFCGGKGLNQSIALSKAGAVVYHAGCVGAQDGEGLLEALKDAGVDTSFVCSSTGVSGHAVIQVDRNGQNCILLFGGANQSITRQQIDETFSHFEEGDVLLLQNEINEIPYLIESGRKKGMYIYLNPSPITKELLDMPLNLVDCFILNEVEATDLCGKKADDGELARLLQEKYPNASILLTLGEKGCIYRDKECCYSQGACSVKVVDTTAAGDTFTGYFIAGVCSGRDVPSSLLYATTAAAIAVSRKGASVSIPSAKEVDLTQV